MGMRLTDITPEEAGRVWASLEVPTLSKLQAKFRAIGRNVEIWVLKRWQDADWKTGTPQAVPADQAKQTLDLAAGTLTGDPASTLADIAPEMAATRVLPIASPDRMTELHTMSDEALLSESARVFERTNVLLMETITEHRKVLVTERPEGLAALLRGIASSKIAVNSTYSQAVALRERTMKLVQDSDPQARQAPMEPSADPLAHFIEASGRQ